MASDVAKFKKQQSLQEAASQQGLHGFAHVSRHDFIEARTTRGAERMLQILEQGNYKTVEHLMNQPNWGLEEEQKDMSHFDAKRLS